MQHPHREPGAPDHEELITSYLHAEPDEQQVAELSRWIAADDANADAFARETFVHRATRDLLIGSAGAVDDVADRLARRARRLRLPRTTPRRAIMAAAAVLLLAASVLSIGLWNRDRSPPAGGAMAVAMLEASIDARWAHAGGPTRVGQAQTLALGEHRLESGLARVRLTSGASLLFEAPAVFTLTDDGIVEVAQGRFTAECRTEASRGLRVRTPMAELIDIGTAFGAIVGPNRTAAVVFEGIVDVLATGPGEAAESDMPARLEADHEAVAAVADARGLRRIAGEEAERLFAPPLVRDSSFDRLADAEREVRAPRKGVVARLLDDPSLVLRVEEGGHRPGPGRFRGDPSITCLDAVEGPDVVVPGEHRAITLAAWVRPIPRQVPGSSFDPRLGAPAREIHRGLLMSDGWGEPGQLHWQLKGETFQVSFPVYVDGPHIRVAAPLEAASDGRWQHLVTTIDLDSLGAVRHYVDGELRASAEVGDATGAVSVGRAVVGGWLESGDGRARRTRPLEGWIDDLYVWTRALDSDEVRALHRATRAPVGGGR